MKKIRKSEARDDKVIKAIKEMKKAEVKMLRNKEWREKNGLMLKEGKVYIVINCSFHQVYFIILFL